VVVQAVVVEVELVLVVVVLAVIENLLHNL
jgi:hypothetical protein